MMETVNRYQNRKQTAGQSGKTKELTHSVSVYHLFSLPELLGYSRRQHLVQQLIGTLLLVAELMRLLKKRL